MKNNKNISMTLLVVIMSLLPSLQVNALPEKSDLSKASKAAGCDLIPYDMRRTKCKGYRVHNNQSCDASPGTCVTAKNCLDARTNVAREFSSTKQDLITAKKKMWQKEQELRKLADDIIKKISDGESGHKTAIKNAQNFKTRICSHS